MYHPSRQPHQRDRSDSREEVKRSIQMHPEALKVTFVNNRKYIRMPNFNKRQVHLLKTWLKEHLDSPYPSHNDKVHLQRISGLNRKQIQIWFTNARKVRVTSL